MFRAPREVSGQSGSIFARGSGLLAYPLASLVYRLFKLSITARTADSGAAYPSVACRRDSTLPLQRLHQPGERVARPSPARDQTLGECRPTWPPYLVLALTCWLLLLPAPRSATLSEADLLS